MVNYREATAIFPQEVDKLPLTKDANYIIGAFFDNEYAMHTASKELNGRKQIRRLWQGDNGSLFGQRDNVSKRYLDSFLGLSRNLCVCVDRIRIWMGQAKNNEEVGIEVSIVEGARSCQALRIVMNEDNMGSSGFNQDLWQLALNQEFSRA